MPEPDPFRSQLSALAPAVDMPASRELFERSRVTAGARRRWLLPAAVTALLLAGVLGVWALARTDGATTVPVAPIDGEQATNGSFDVLAIVPTASPPGSIHRATNDAEFGATMALLDQTLPNVRVDFDESIVAVFNLAGDACPADLTGFDVSDDTWTPRFAPPGRSGCDDVGITWAYVVAFDRSRLASMVRFRMPTDLLGNPPIIDEPAPGSEFEVVAVAETRLPFGSIRAATSEAEADAMWAEDLPGAARPDIDFEQRFVVSFTLPDDACPDTLVQFRSGTDARPDHVVWQPEFEPPPGGCDEPLITRTYAVAIDRPPVVTDITFHLPGDDVYGYPDHDLTVAVDAMITSVRLGPPAPSGPDAVATDIRLPLPPIGEPALHAGTFGIVWVAQHDDGTVSVLDAVVDRPADEDEGGVIGLGMLVVPTEDGSAFGGAGVVWDAHGRAVNAPRTSDLVGFAGNVTDSEVELFLTTEATIPGRPDPVGDATFIRPRLETLPPIDLETLATLSFSGPIWRQLDATLVVEGGVGTLCAVDPDVPVPDLAGCGGDGVPTAVTSSLTDVTGWYFGPVLAEFDEFGKVVQIVPLGGQASRNDGPDGVAPQPSGDGWRQLARFTSQVPAAPIALAIDTGSFGRMGRSIGMAPLPDVDFETSIVVSFTVAADPCLPSLASLLTSEVGVVTPAFEPPEVSECRASLQSFTFVVELDRSRFDDAIRITAPQVVDSFARPPGIDVMDDATFRIDDGALVAGGLSITDGVSVVCRKPGGPVLSAPVEAIGTRSFRLEFRVDGEVVWEAAGVGRSLTVATSIDLASIPPGTGEIVASSTDPPAEFRRPFGLSRAELDDLVADCG